MAIIKYTLVQLIVADYRREVFNLINEKLSGSIATYCGKKHFEAGLETKVDLHNNVIFVKNLFFISGKLIFQIGTITPSLKSEKLILELNPRILSNWIILILRKILLKKTVLWGHAWGRNGPTSRSEPIRKIMRNLSDTIIVYTEKQKLELKNQGSFTGKIIAAPNSLYSKKSMTPIVKKTRNNLIYVGRLVKNKNVDRVIKSIPKVLEKFPEFMLEIVGDGPELGALKDLAEKLGVKSNILFHGHVSDKEKLRSIYSNALFSTSPGYVGLSITQSFGFGIPMIISKNENHSPEIECAKESVNSIFFDAEIPDDFAEKIIAAWSNKNYWINLAPEISKECSNMYSSEKMCEKIIEAFHG